MADDADTVTQSVDLTSDGELIASGMRPTQAQIGVAVGIAALVAVLIALALVASRR